MHENVSGAPVPNESWVAYQTSQGTEMRAPLVRITRHLAIFEVASPFTPLQVSETLTEFKILVGEAPIYSGRAVVRSLIDEGPVVVCEATLDDSWLEVEMVSTPQLGQKLRTSFQRFLTNTEPEFRIVPEVKLAIADLQILLLNLRNWFEQVELGIRSQPQGDRSHLERKTLDELQPSVLPKLAGMFQQFESAFSKVDPDLRPAHGNYLKRQLHPLVLCAPFMYRTFKKPLGYAGDYEMVNMMVRDPYEGSSMFAKMLNTFFLNTPPVVAHRNRITYLIDQLQAEAARAERLGRPARIYNLGCGPAKEIQEFLRLNPLARHTEFTLVDFNEETINYTHDMMQPILTKARLTTPVKLVKKSVAQVLKDAAKPGPRLNGQYDYVYCAGLFDYLPDSICHRLMDLFYDMLAPGGLLVVTNVDSSNPCQNWMEYSVDWHLIYRNHKKFSEVAPKKVSPEQGKIHSDLSGVNIYFETRKPPHG